MGNCEAHRFLRDMANRYQDCAENGPWRNQLWRTASVPWYPLLLPPCSSFLCYWLRCFRCSLQVGGYRHFLCLRSPHWSTVISSIIQVCGFCSPSSLAVLSVLLPSKLSPLYLLSSFSIFPSPFAFFQHRLTVPHSLSLPHSLAVVTAFSLSLFSLVLITIFSLQLNCFPAPCCCGYLCKAAFESILFYFYRPSKLINLRREGWIQQFFWYFMTHNPLCRWILGHNMLKKSRKSKFSKSPRYNFRFT